MYKFLQTILLLTCFTFAVNTQAQIINIPDANFKQFLISSSAKDSLGNNFLIDANNDDEIDQSEALRVFYLKIFPVNIYIKDLTGIEFFNNIRTLECYTTSLTSLNVSNLTYLNRLQCTQNQLTSLNISGLKNLQYLNCYSNRLTSLDLRDATNLNYLKCDVNQLTSLDLSALTNLNYLDCSFNILTNLNVEKLINLESLRILRNNLKNINITGLSKLYKFDCRDNYLTSIYMKNVDSRNINWPQYQFEGNSLIYICADESDISSVNSVLYISHVNSATVSSFCNSTLDGTLFSLRGNIKFDTDNNGCTSSDPLYPNLKIKIKNDIDSGYAIANTQGNFTMDLDSGTYTLTPQPLNDYFNCTPTSTTITLPEDTIPQQFCITPNGTHHDLSVTIIPIRAARPGFSDATYKIVLKNNGNQIENGTVLFNYDESRQDYISSTSTPLSLSSGELIFSFSNLQLFATYEIIVTMRTNAPTDNPAVNVGDVIQLSVTANLDNGVRDEFFKDNFQNIKQTVIGSFDPNDKTCLEGDIITPVLVGDFVNYLIRFENTGTANAENIVVTDFIDLNTFDISTLEITSTSHNCKTLISNGNKVQFVFDNINLPFTEPLKHGYVAFKIKLKNNLGIGYSLKNKADIYFDYNLPITTNTAASRIDNITAIKTNANKDGSLSIYPNPGNGNFIVNFESPVRQTIIVKIVAINGNVVYEQNLYHNYQSQLQLNQNLPAGVYLITVNSEKEQYKQKLIITK
jgi:uncharacterized repeat protein (TIGR01451 family)